MPYKFKLGNPVVVKDVPSVRRDRRRAYIGKPTSVTAREYNPAKINFGTWYLTDITCYLFRGRELEAAPAKTRKNRAKTEPLPCPFCGADPNVIPWHGGGKRKRMVVCQNDACHIGPSVTGSTRARAVARWDDRP